MKHLLPIALFALPSTLAIAGELIPVDVPEPSGLDTDAETGRIFVADDGGEVWVLDEDFSEIASFDLGGDLEGIEYLPVLDSLLVAVEGAEQLLLVDPDTGDLLEVYDIPRTFLGETILSSGGQGIETLTVVGPRIFVANQAFEHENSEDGSILVELALTPWGDLEIVDAHPLPVLDIAGSLYSVPNGELFLLSDLDDSIYRLSIRAMDQLPTGAPIPSGLLPSFWVPGENQEGICLSDGQLLIAQDSGDLYRAGSLQWLTSPMGQATTIEAWGY